MESFCKDLDVDPEDIGMLVLAWHFQPAEMGYFTRDEFLSGFSSLGVESMTELSELLPKFRNEINDPTKFKEIYKFAFNFARGKTKSIDISLAQSMLLLVMKGKPHTDLFVEFLGVQTTYRVLNFDQWLLFPEFSSNVDVSLKNHSVESAWPVIYDEYVEWLKQQRKSKTNIMDTSL